MMAAAGMIQSLPQFNTTGIEGNVTKYVKQVALKDYGETWVQGNNVFDNYYYNYTAPKWDNSGCVITSMAVESATSPRSTITVRFSDFGVGVLLPGDTKHYIATSTKNDTPKGEQAASAKNDTNNTVTITQSLSKAVTESITSTINHSFSYGFTEGVKVTAGTEGTAGFATFKISTELSFSASQTISDGWSKSQATTKSTTTTNSVNVTLPPYTTAMMKQGESDATVTTKYNCPVMLSYKVEIIYHSSLLLDAGLSFNRDARENLRQRALVDVDYDPQNINWRTVLADKDFKDAIEKIASHAPMSPTGATMAYTNHTTYSEVSGIAPLYPLSYVDMGTPNIYFIENSVATMHVGDYSYTKYLPVNGYNYNNAAYYGFNSSYGHWVVVGDDGNTELTSSNAPVIIENSAVKGYTKFKAVRSGHCYMKYIIDENAYPSGLSSNSYTKNSDLSRTAMLEINVLEQKVTYEIDGNFYGIVNSAPEKLEADGKLVVHAYDITGKEVESTYKWEPQEIQGIKLTEDGTVSFTRGGTFHVRVFSPGGECRSDWKAIAAQALGSDYVEPDETINRTDSANDDTQFVISGKFTGGVSLKSGDARIPAPSESLEGDGKLQVETHTSSAKEEAVQYTWEADENSSGITITADGKVSFTSPGIYNVRVRSTKADGDYVISDWVEIRASEIVPARILRVPTARDYYQAEAPSLLDNDGTYEGGLGFLYGVGSDDITEPAEYSTEIPTATGAGTYYVWCKVQPDDSHSESEAVCVTVALEGASGDESTPTPDTDNDNDSTNPESNTLGVKSSSGGCDMGLSGLMLTALAVMILKRR